MSWNLWWRFGDEPERRAPAIAATLAAVDPDVVCVQEVYGDDTGADDGAALAAALGLRCVAAPAVFHQGRSFGNAVLTRWPVLASGAERLPGPDGTPGHRRAVWAVLDAPCGPTAFVSTHLAYRFDESAVRLLQVGALCRLAARLRAELGSGSAAATEPRDLPPVVLCGDLNAQPDSDEVRALTGRSAPPVPNLVFTDCWPQVRDDPGHTWDRRNPYLRDATWPQRRLDYVLTSWPRRAPVGNPVQAFLVGDAPVDGVWPSDHLGVAVDLRLG